MSSSHDRESESLESPKGKDVTTLTLLDFVKRSPASLPRHVKETVVKDLLTQLHDLHRCGLSYNYLHPGNVIVEDGFKLCPFSKISLTEPLPPWQFFAPELNTNILPDSNDVATVSGKTLSVDFGVGVRHRLAADVYSIGKVILWLSCLGKNCHLLQDSIVTSMEEHPILHRILVKDACKRPTLKELTSVTWFTSFIDSIEASSGRSSHVINGKAGLNREVCLRKIVRDRSCMMIAHKNKMSELHKKSARNSKTSVGLFTMSSKFNRSDDNNSSFDSSAEWLPRSERRRMSMIKKDKKIAKKNNLEKDLDSTIESAVNFVSNNYCLPQIDPFAPDPVSIAPSIPDVKHKVTRRLHDVRNSRSSLSPVNRLPVPARNHCFVNTGLNSCSSASKAKVKLETKTATTSSQLIRLNTVKSCNSSRDTLFLGKEFDRQNVNLSNVPVMNERFTIISNGGSSQSLHKSFYSEKVFNEHYTNGISSRDADVNNKSRCGYTGVTYFKAKDERSSCIDSECVPRTLNDHDIRSSCCDNGELDEIILILDHQGL